jgi:hypothetical protein
MGILSIDRTLKMCSLGAEIHLSGIGSQAIRCFVIKTLETNGNNMHVELIKAVIDRIEEF